MRFLQAGLLSVALAVPVAPAQAQLVGQLNETRPSWVNQLGSVLMLKGIDPTTGQMAGSFTTAVGCGAGVTRPMTGFVNNTSIAFTVTFGECDSVTAWSGRIDPESLEISTLWQWSSGQDDWERITAGADIFRQVP